MKKHISFMIIVLGILLVSPVMALESWGTGTQNQNFTITQICNDATYITLTTIQLPDKTVQVINTNMTSTGYGGFQYNQTENSQIGHYDVLGISDGCENSFAGYYEITPSGRSGADNIVFFVVVLVLLYFLTIYFFSKRDVDLAPFVTLSGIALGLLGVYMVQNGIIIYIDWMTTVISYTTWGIGFGLALWSLIEWIESLL